jgi:MFS family permease
VIGTFWTLGAVHVVSVTGDAEFAPTFIAVSILGGALVQYPIGLASDHIDRRYVLTFLCVMSSLAALYLSTATDTVSLLIGAAAFGAASNSLYAISLAKAADNSERDEFVMIGSSVLLLNAVGAAIGSFIFGWAMRSAEGDILFTLIAIACALIAVFIAIQPKGITAVAIEEQSSFVAATSATAPAALQQDPRAGDIAEEDQLVPAELSAETELSVTITREVPSTA